MAEGTTNPYYEAEKGEQTGDEEKEKQEATRLNHLQSNLAHLQRKSYYNGHLDLSRENLRRWLDASDNCVLLAGARLLNSVALRRKIKQAGLTATNNPPHALSNHFGGGMCGLDRDGSPVYFLLFALTDMHGIQQSCTRDQLLVYWAAQFESMIERLKLQAKHGKNKVHNILLIVDMQGCSFQSLSWSVLCAWAMAIQLFQDLNPGLFKEILLIEPPTTLSAIHRFLSPHLKRSTKDLITVIGGHNCLRHLLVRLEKHEIPAYLGGYRCDVDNNPKCRQDIVWPDKVPRWTYLSNPCLPADIIDIAVEAGSVYKKELLVSAIGSRVRFLLYDVTHPVTLSMMPPAPPPVPDTSKSRQVKPRPVYTLRLKGMEGTQGGAIFCQSPGTYSLVLDNSKDLIHTARAKAKIEILLPEKFYGRFVSKLPLGDNVDFYSPVTPAERKMRQDLILACETCPAVDLNSYY